MSSFEEGGTDIESRITTDLSAVDSPLELSACPLCCRQSDFDRDFSRVRVMTVCRQGLSLVDRLVVVDINDSPIDNSVVYPDI